jgi:hypothetical protein
MIIACRPEYLPLVLVRFGLDPNVTIRIHHDLPEPTGGHPEYWIVYESQAERLCFQDIPNQN